MTDSRPETNDILTIFRTLAMDEQLVGCGLDLKRRDSFEWDELGMPKWVIVVFLPNEDEADAVVRLNGFAKANRLEIELGDGFLWLTPKGLGTE